MRRCIVSIAACMLVGWASGRFAYETTIGPYKEFREVLILLFLGIGGTAILACLACSLLRGRSAGDTAGFPPCLGIPVALVVHWIVYRPTKEMWTEAAYLVTVFGDFLRTTL
jgi:hypothetical protein